MSFSPVEVGLRQLGGDMGRLRSAGGLMGLLLVSCGTDSGGETSETPIPATQEPGTPAPVTPNPSTEVPSTTPSATSQPATPGTSTPVPGTPVPATPTATDVTPTPEDGTILKLDLLGPNLLNASLTACTLADGTQSTCWELVFGANPINEGPYCPDTINDLGGLGAYDGQTNPGFQPMKADLWNAMEADGYDIVDPNGNIRIADPAEAIDQSYSYCLEGSPNDDLVLTFLIPEVPMLLNTPDTIETVEFFGVSVDGVPMNGPPPSVVSGPPGGGGGPPQKPTKGGGNIPAIDRCGGHQDPAGYYHWHLIPESANDLFDAIGIDDFLCTAIEQGDGLLSGYARDGYPIYTATDANGTLPANLDTCSGHTGVTADYPGGIYHYHALPDTAPNVVPCIKGVAASTPFEHPQ